MKMRNGMTVACHIAEAETPIEDDPLFEPLVVVEGDRGSVQTKRGFQVSVTDAEGTRHIDATPPPAPWADPAYLLGMSSMADCIANLLGHLEGTAQAETTGADNFETVRLVFGAYESFRSNVLVRF